LKARATPGVEAVVESCYRRTIAVGEDAGTMAVSHVASRQALELELRLANPRALLKVVERVRRLFDLEADPASIGEQLGRDPLLRERVKRHPGIRTPGAWDGFELAVRAVLGQQISVRAATTLAGRVAALFGTRVVAQQALERLFPTPEQLACADLERAGVLASRADAIRSLARGACEGTLAFAPHGDAGATIAALRRVPGIGDWTAQYIAMRALGEPDAFPCGDLVLRRMADARTAKSARAALPGVAPVAVVRGDAAVARGER
jgi:AraC family transcriptional regulator of adaptative response / DNA-3-methyladenine glycosylase II